MIDNSVLVEDGKNYLVMDTIIDNSIRYIYFVNEKNNSDFFIRKEVNKGEQKYLINLDNEDEFNHATTLFAEKHKEN